MAIVYYPVTENQKILLSRIMKNVATTSLQIASPFHVVHGQPSSKRSKNRLMGNAKAPVILENTMSMF